MFKQKVEEMVDYINFDVPMEGCISKTGIYSVLQSELPKLVPEDWYVDCDNRVCRTDGKKVEHADISIEMEYQQRLVNAGSFLPLTMNNIVRIIIAAREFELRR